MSLALKIAFSVVAGIGIAAASFIAAKKPAAAAAAEAAAPVETAPVETVDPVVEAVDPRIAAYRLLRRAEDLGFYVKRADIAYSAVELSQLAELLADYEAMKPGMMKDFAAKTINLHLS